MKVSELTSVGGGMFPVTRAATPEEESAIAASESEQPITAEPTAAELAAQITELQEALDLLIAGATE